MTSRRLASVDERRLLATPADAAGLLPLALPELFDTAELAQAVGIERRLAQQMTYCLQAMGTRVLRVTPGVSLNPALRV